MTTSTMYEDGTYLDTATLGIMRIRLGRRTHSGTASKKTMSWLNQFAKSVVAGVRF